MAEFWYKPFSTWLKAEELWYNHNGTWRNAQELWYNENGTWRLVYEYNPGVVYSLFWGGGTITNGRGNGFTWETDGDVVYQGTIGGDVNNAYQWVNSTPAPTSFTQNYEISWSQVFGVSPTIQFAPQNQWVPLTSNRFLLPGIGGSSGLLVYIRLIGDTGSGTSRRYDSS